MLDFFKRLTSTGKTQQKEEQFWSWFVKNKSKIERFIDSEQVDYSIYDELTKKMKKYNALLFPELTKTKEDKYVLIITPDGIKEGLQATKKLGESAPEIEQWLIKKFRQPNDEIILNFDGLEYPAQDIELLAEIREKDEQVDVNVFIRRMDRDPSRYQALAFLYLDHILGEFNTITKVGYINFHSLEENKSVKGAISLLELRKLIEEKLY